MRAFVTMPIADSDPIDGVDKRAPAFLRRAPAAAGQPKP
jgi:hypothetical protein